MNRRQMATPPMLRQRNSQKRVIKLPENRLTLKGRLTRLESTKVGFRRLGLEPELSLLRDWIVGWLSAASIIAVAGCATMGGLGKDSTIEAKRTVLAQRINARWDALIKGDVDTAYTYLSSASKEAYPLNVYKNKVKPGAWRSVKIDEIGCDADICWAKMILTYDHKVIKGVQTPFTEHWIIEKGNAWFVYEPSV
jgi:hypothetical protein